MISSGIVYNRLEGLVVDYLAHCRAKGLAPNTVTGAYAFPLNQVFLPWCAKEGITEPEQLTSRALDRVSAELLTLAVPGVHFPRRPCTATSGPSTTCFVGQGRRAR